jgi:hypothetical protein
MIGEAGTVTTLRRMATMSGLERDALARSTSERLVCVDKSGLQGDCAGGGSPMRFGGSRAKRSASITFIPGNLTCPIRPGGQDSHDGRHY